MSGLQIHAESGLLVLRHGAASRGSAVALVLPLTLRVGPSTPLPAPVSSLVDDLQDDGATVYLVGSTHRDAASGAQGLRSWRDTLLPRALDRIVRDAKVDSTGPLHLVGVGLGGSLLAAALLEAPTLPSGRLPPGAVVLVGSAVDWGRAPVLRRARRLLSSWRLSGLEVPVCVGQAVVTGLAGPRAWTARPADGFGEVPAAGGRMSGALIDDLSRWSPTGGRRVQRNLLLVHGNRDAVFPAAVSRPLHAVWGGPVRVQHVDGEGHLLAGLSATRSALRAHLAGAPA